MPLSDVPKGQPSVTTALYKRLQDHRISLLDLTGRNPLLNFKHTRSSKRWLRIVDEVPGNIVGQLVAGETFRCAHLGPQARGLLEGLPSEVLDAFAHAKEHDKEYLAQLEAVEGDTSVRLRERIERALLERVLKQHKVDDDQLSSTTTVASLARAKGIDPSFDLPAGSSSKARHRDKVLQTLLDEEALDGVLAKIHEQHQESLSETGINTLHLIVGFLEWYEAPSSDKALLAPLLLLPLEMSRHPHRGGFKTELSAAGEPPQVNITLREKLKREFGIALPGADDLDWEDGASRAVEEYFGEVASAIEPQSGWRVRRMCTISHLKFSLMAMYEDLDPDRWAEGESLTTGAPLGRVLGGSCESDAGEIVEARLELDDISSPRLPEEADSSQLAAIKKALKGRDLVIHGPPGTGKSQTITNLIAAAISEGKSVLFVAEKRAALQVVQKRLEGVGLSDFLLEIHSNKARRKDVADSLRRRLETPQTSDPSGQSISDAQRIQQTLGDYAAAINSPCLKTGLSIHEALWRIDRLRQRLASINLGFTRLPCDSLSGASTGEQEAASGKVAASSQASSDAQCRLSERERHPWAGLLNASMSAFTVREVERETLEVSGCVRSLEGACVELSNSGWGLSSQMRLSELSDVGGVLFTLPVPPSTPLPVDWTCFAAESDRTTIKQLIDLRRKELTAAADLRAAQRPALDADVAEAWRTSVARISSIASSLSLSSADYNGLRIELERSAARAEALRLVSDALAPILSAVAVDSASVLTGESAGALIALIPRCQRMPTAAVRSQARLPWTFDQMISLERSLADSDERDAQRAANPWLARVPDDVSSQMLSDAATTIQATGLWGRLFSSAYRRAVGVAVRVMPSDTNRRDRQAMVDDLRRAIEYRALCERCGRSTALAQLGVRAEDSSTAQIRSFSDAVRWAAKVRADAGTSPVSEGIVERFLALPERAFERVAKMLAAVPDSIAQLEVEAGPLAGVLQRAERRVAQIRDLLEDIDALPTVPEGAISTWSQQTDAECQRVHAYADLVARASSARALVRDHPRSRTPIHGDQTGSDIDLEVLKTLLAYGQAVAEHIGAVRAKRLFSSSPLDVSVAYEAGERLTSAVKQVVEQLEVIKRLGAGLQGWLASAGGPPDSRISDLRAAIDRATAAIATAPAYHSLLLQLAECEQAGVRELVDALDKAEIPTSHWVDCYWLWVLQAASKQAINASLALRTTTAASRAEACETYGKLLRTIKRDNARWIRSRLVSRLITAGVAPPSSRRDWTEDKLVYLEAGKQKRHLPIRKLLQQASNAIQDIKPCFLMSPLSVAQYLPPSIRFDLVIMDEASQLRPQHALGAIARARQIVVVGDEQQLPPTNFFHSGSQDDHDDDDLVDDVNSKSILDEAKLVCRDRAHLTWHYRSRHPSLIGYSNQAFYEQRLQLFPATCEPHAGLGIQLHYLPDAVYGTGLNVLEAQRLVDAAIGHMTSHADQSLGIVAVNIKQSEIILDLLQQRIASDPAATAYFDRWNETLEPLFVKNLENVQGDERDTIFVSTVYGPATPGGRPAQRFGPINSAFGHRRLNVLFTRAKSRLHIFTSLRSADILDGEQPSEGKRHFKGFLQYAESGRTQLPSLTDREPDSPFEIAVASRLRARGWEVVHQVGMAGYFIDLAVRNPARPGEFLLGIECDGAQYHSAKNARDRDRLRQQVLESFGWKIHRIWSLDWFQDAESQMRKLDERLAALAAASR